MADQKITLVDGSGFIFRAYYAIRPLSNAKGLPTNAVYGFVTMLLKYLDQEKPKRIAMVFDTPKPTFRKEKYPEYKANRQAPPDDLVVQIPYIHKFVDAMRIPRLDKPGWEADDIIGTLAKRASVQGCSVDIVTGDKDMMQLVTDRVHLVDTMRDKRIDPSGVVERFGVRPDQIIDFLALMGDNSDNIPGVTGIGEKTASELIKTFGSLDGLYAKLEDVKQPKRRLALETEKDSAYLSQELATILTDMPLDVTWDQLEWNGPDEASLQVVLTELGFSSLLKRFSIEEGASPMAAPVAPKAVDATPVAVAANIDRSKYRCIRTKEALDDLVTKLKASPLVSVDTETTGASVQKDELVGLSFSWAKGEAAYIPVGHVGLVDAEQLSAAQVREALRPVLESATPKKVGQNAKFHVQVLRRWGIEIQGVTGDTLLLSYLIDPSASHNLDSLALRYLDHKTIPYEDLTGKGKKQISITEVPIDRAAEYSAEEADVTLRLYQLLAPKVRENDMQKLYDDVEMPSSLVLADMEYRGVFVDPDRLDTFGKKLDAEMKETEASIHAHAGGSFNIQSPKQLSEILFVKLGLPVVRRTKTGISTDEAVLTELAEEHPICREVLRFRELAKLRSTYVDGLLAEVNPRTGRVHTCYNQTVAATGRLSSSNPNLQNIPIVGGGGAAIRAAFRAAEGCVLLSADYSQVELRLLAHLSGDPELSRAFREDEDVHSYTAKLIFETPTVTSEQRRVAKTINFGVVYGQTAFGLSQTLRIGAAEAKKFIEAYFRRYAEVHRFQEELVEAGKQTGYVATMMGRRRYLPDLNAKNRMVRDMAERAAINAPIQGSAADLVKKAMVAVERRLRREKLKSQLILQVHDELVLEVPVAEKAAAEKIVREEMEGAMQLSVPLKADVGFGADWAECKE